MRRPPGSTPFPSTTLFRSMRINAARHASDPGAPESSQAAIYNTADPVQALANMESMTLEAVFILKDFHRHLDNAVVVRRLRSEEHTSELQSLRHLVCRLRL